MFGACLEIVGLIKSCSKGGFRLVDGWFRVGRGGLGVGVGGYLGLVLGLFDGARFGLG